MKRQINKSRRASHELQLSCINKTCSKRKVPKSQLCQVRWLICSWLSSPLLVISVKFTVSSEFTVFSNLCLQLWLSLLQMWSWWDDDVVMIDCQWRSSLLQVAALWTALWKFLNVWITKILGHWAQFKSTSCYIPSSSNTWQYSSVLFITQVCTKICGISQSCVT